MALGIILAVWCVAGLFNPYLLRIEDRDWIEAQALKNAGASAADSVSAE